MSTHQELARRPVGSDDQRIRLEQALKDWRRGYSSSERVYAIARRELDAKQINARTYYAALDEIGCVDNEQRSS